MKKLETVWSKIDQHIILQIVNQLRNLLWTPRLS
jgi:hypothetical protein